MAIASGINFARITSGVRSLSGGLKKMKESTGRMQKYVLNVYNVKRKNFADSRTLSARRDEMIRVKDREEESDAASSRSRIFSRPYNALARSTKGFLGRLMDFLGSILVGWLVYNLPSIITMVNDTVSRVFKLFNLLKSFVSNVIGAFVNLGNVMGALLTNVVTLDFFDTSKRLENAVGQLNSNFGQMKQDFEDGIKLFTTPLGQMPGEEPVAPMGTKYETPAGAGAMEGGTNEQKVMSFLISYGLTPAQAAGVAGNLKQESTFRPNADNGTHHGIAQWDKKIRWPRVSAYIRSIGKDPNTLEGQLYGLVWEAQTRGDWSQIKQSKSSRQAAHVWLKRFEISGEEPGMAGYENRMTYASGLESKYKGYNPQEAKPGQPTIPTLTPASANVISVGKGILSQGFEVAENKYFTKFKGFNPRGNSPVGRHASPDHGTNALDITDWRGSEASGIPRLKNLFLSLYTNKERYGIKALIFDPIGYWFTGMKTYSKEAYGGHSNHLHVGFTKSADTALKSDKDLGAVALAPAPQGTNIPSSITPSRQGPQINIIDNKQRSLPPLASQGGSNGGTVPIPQTSPTEVLNNMVRKQMLLDLAYT